MINDCFRGVVGVVFFFLGGGGGGRFVSVRDCNIEYHEKLFSSVVFIPNLLRHWKRKARRQHAVRFTTSCTRVRGV